MGLRSILKSQVSVLNPWSFDNDATKRFLKALSNADNLNSRQYAVQQWLGFVQYQRGDAPPPQGWGLFPAELELLLNRTTASLGLGLERERLWRELCSWLADRHDRAVELPPRGELADPAASLPLILRTMQKSIAWGAMLGTGDLLEPEAVSKDDLFLDSALSGLSLIALIESLKLNGFASNSPFVEALLDLRQGLIPADAVRELLEAIEQRSRDERDPKRFRAWVNQYVADFWENVPERWRP